MSLVEPPGLAGIVHRVADPPAVADFHSRLLDAVVSDGPAPGWLRVDLGWNQALYLAPGGRRLPELGDRWERQGLLPIVRTYRMAELERRLAGRDTRWVTPPFDYTMRGTGRLGYLHDPANQPLGLQQRFSDSDREEDLVADSRHARRDDGPAAGLGWLVLQAHDIDATRDFYARALQWVQRRGTVGFGWMMRISPTTTLQIAFRGVRQDPGRDLGEEPALGMLRAPVDAVVEAVVSAGGRRGHDVDGFASVLDPEGHAWLVAAAV